MRTHLPEVTTDGLVLWRLRRRQQEFVCRVTDFCGELALVVHNLARRDVPRGEAHQDIVSLVRRADAVRNIYLAAGWREVDPEASELHNEP